VVPSAPGIAWTHPTRRSRLGAVGSRRCLGRPPGDWRRPRQGLGRARMDARRRFCWRGCEQRLLAPGAGQPRGGRWRVRAGDRAVTAGPAPNSISSARWTFGDRIRSSRQSTATSSGNGARSRTRRDTTRMQN